MQAGESRPNPAIASGHVEVARLGRTDRRLALLDAAAAMVAAGDVDKISMESVAEQAGVSRTLVYKHFLNRDDLVAALFERESAHLHSQLSSAVREAASLEEMFRVLVNGALAAQADRGATFAALGSSGDRRGHRKLQGRRDAQTLRYFAHRAMVEFKLDEQTATAGLAISLGAISTVLWRWRLKPTPEHARLLEESFVAMAMGGLGHLSERRSSH